MITRPTFTCNLISCTIEDEEEVYISLADAVRGKVTCPNCNGTIALSDRQRQDVFDFIDDRADKLFEPEEDDI